MDITYTMREDGRIFETVYHRGSAKHVTPGKSVDYKKFDELPPEHEQVILALIAGGAGEDEFNIGNLGHLKRGRQNFRWLDGTTRTENVVFFKLYFGEATDDTNRRTEHRGAPRPLPFI